MTMPVLLSCMTVFFSFVELSRIYSSHYIRACARRHFAMPLYHFYIFFFHCTLLFGVSHKSINFYERHVCLPKLNGPHVSCNSEYYLVCAVYGFVCSGHARLSWAPLRHVRGDRTGKWQCSCETKETKTVAWCIHAKTTFETARVFIECRTLFFFVFGYCLCFNFQLQNEIHEFEMGIIVGMCVNADACGHTYERERTMCSVKIYVYETADRRRAQHVRE